MTETASTPRRTLNPLFLVIVVPILMLMLLVGVVMLAQKFVTQQGLTESEVKLPDGSILKIEALTFGSAHNLSYQIPVMGFGAFTGSGTRMLSASAGPKQVVVWMSRRHAESRQPLDFEWWQENVVVDAFDEELSDYDLNHGSSTVLHQLSAHGHSMNYVNQRPLKCDRTSYTAWVIASALPVHRSKDDRIRLKVKNTDGKVVAEFNLPHPSPTAFPVWTAESLPRTFTSGDLEVTVKDLTTHGHEYRSNDRLTTNYWANATAEFKWKGMPTNEWQQWAHFKSPLGTTLGTSSIDPTKREKVWRMQLTCSKIATARFDAAETGTIKGLKLQKAEKSANSGLAETINGSTVEVVTIGGSGKQKFDLTSTRLGFGSGSYSSSNGNYVFEKSVHWQFESRGGGITNITVDSPFAWILLDRGASSVSKSFYVKVVDDQGREVKSELQGIQNNLSVLYLQPESDAKTVTLDIKVHSPVTFEAYVELPEPKVQKAQ